MADERLPLVLAGHSHAIAMGLPAGNGTAPARLKNMPFDGADLVGVTGSWPRDDSYWDAFVAAASSRAPVLVWDGNQHQSLFLFDQAPSFDFVLSFAPDWPVSTDRLLVPEAMLREFLAPSIAPLFGLLQQLRERTTGPIFVVGTPPPKGDAVEMRKRVDVDAILLKWASALSANPHSVELTPLPIMLKLWMLVQDMMVRAARTVGAIYVPVPARAKDANGFLARSLWSTDVTHANAAWGAIMMEEVLLAARQAAALGAIAA